MKTIKLLIISFTLTFITLITIAPAIAAPSAKVQHLQVNNMLTTAHISKFSTKNSINFSTGLILSSANILTEESENSTLTVVETSNDFFTSAMIMSDKINQLFSYFNSSAKDNISKQIKPEPTNKLIKDKCSSNPKYS